MPITHSPLATVYVLPHDFRMTSRDGAGDQSHLGAYRQYQLAADRPRSTVNLRCYHITRLMRDVRSPLAATTEDLVEWLAQHTTWSTETRRSYRASMRSFYGWAHASGRIPADPSRALPLIRPKAGIPRPAPEDTIRGALERAEHRERLMIMLGAQAGLRRGEIAQVHTRDVVPDLGGWSLRVRGKGRRERLVPLLGELARALRAQPAGFVFPSPAGGHLTPAHVGKLMSRALGPDVTPHQLRHRFATRAYAQSGDLYAVQDLLGHAKPETTEIYAQMPTGRTRSIVEAAA